MSYRSDTDPLLHAIALQIRKTRMHFGVQRRVVITQPVGNDYSVDDKHTHDAAILALKLPHRVRPANHHDAYILDKRGRFDALTDADHMRLGVGDMTMRFTAALDSSSLEPGTPQTWNSGGGTVGPTWLITCTTLAVATGTTATTGIRTGAKMTTGLLGQPANSPFTLTNNVMPELLTVDFKCQMVSSAAAGGEVDVYFAFSDSATPATDNPGGVGGVDAAGPAYDQLPQLVLVGGLILSAAVGTGVQQVWGMPVVPLDQYFSPVVVNNGSVTLDATALHTNLVVTPWYRVRQV